MKNIDKIIFGDNQFFGINHMSQEKAQQLSERFQNLESIIEVYDIAYKNGIRSFMLNSNDRANEICNYFKSNKSKYPELNWYPSIPYPHKYANLISEKGIISTLNDILFKDNSTIGLLGMFAKGSSALISKDAIKLLQMLIDVEVKIFTGLDIKVIFLQNIITDLLLGYEVGEIFYEYCAYIKQKYNVIPGFITQNMPHLKDKLNNWGISGVVICTSINDIGYLMSPSREKYIDSINSNDETKYKIMCMSTMASGAINAEKAYSFINSLNIQSVVFGASSKQHIKQTVALINK